MINDPLLKLMSLSLVTSEGSVPLISSPHHHHQQNLQNLYHQHIFYQQNQAAAAAAAAMLVHNGRLPGGSPIPVPSPSSSLSHPESPRSQAADSSSSPPMTMMTIKESSGKVGAMLHKSGSEKANERIKNDEEEIILDNDVDDNDEVLSIGGKDDEQMMMDCDSSSAPETVEGEGNIRLKGKEVGGSSDNNKINGNCCNDGRDDDEEIDKRINPSVSPSNHQQDRPVRCHSAATTTTTAASMEEDQEDVYGYDESLEDESDNRNPSEANNASKRLKSHKSTQDNHISQKSQNNHHHHHNPFNIANLSRQSPTDDMYSRHQHHLLHHQISPTSLPHPSNYFLHHSHFFHQHLINNHDTSSNHSTASSTNNSTSPSPSTTFNTNFLQHHHLHQQQQQHHQQQQTAAVAAAQSLIFSIANILRPDFGLCNNNNNNNNGSNNSKSQKSSSSHHIAALHGVGAKRHSSGSGSSANSSNDKINHYNGKLHAGMKRSSGQRESSATGAHHRNSTTTPIDLSRPSSTGSASMQMISPNSIMSMMLDRRGVGSGAGGIGATHNKSRNQHHSTSHQKGTSKSDKYHPASLEKGKAGEKPSRVVTPSTTPVNLDSGGATNGKTTNSSSSGNNNKTTTNNNSSNNPDKTLWPAWVYCTRYSDRPSSGPRTRRVRKNKEKEVDEKRPRTAFTAEQLSRLKKEFEENRYLTEKRRQDLARDLKLHENQIKIWFQNKRAKLKKATGSRGGLAMQLMAQGLYNHSTIPPRDGDSDEDEDDDDDC